MSGVFNLRSALPRAQRGVTLIELIAFIVIMAVVAAAMVHAFSGTMRGSHLGKEMTKATHLAQERMEVILGQRKRLGYTGFIGGTYDPCRSAVAPWSSAQLCAAVSGYSVASELSDPDACGTGCSQVTVTVTGTNSGTLATLTAQLWNY